MIKSLPMTTVRIHLYQLFWNPKEDGKTAVDYFWLDFLLDLLFRSACVDPLGLGPCKTGSLIF